LEDPDYIESSSNTQAILIGLVLMADDYGRGLAHTGILARKLNKAEGLIEETLRELEACQMLVCYQGERYRYYSLCHWNEWQTLSKPTPSKYPAPPSQPVASLPQDFPLLPKNPQENPGGSWETPPEGEEEEEQEREGKRREVEGEEERPPANVVTFPTCDDGRNLSQEQILRLTRQVADILKLPVTAALSRIVEEFVGEEGISLTGEADSAREYIENPRRNHKRKVMTPAFFREWLKREREGVRSRYVQRQALQATGIHGSRAARPPEPRQGKPSSSDPDPYRAFLEQRVQDARVGTITSSSPEGRSS